MIIDQADGQRLPTNLCTGVALAKADALTIGVLALQGGFHEHKVMLSKLGARVHEVRQAVDLETHLDGLVIPGGESTTMANLARHLGLLEPLRAFVASGRPVMGTCAGLIFLADCVDGKKTGGQEHVGGLDVTVRRNYFGSQVDSFKTSLRASFSSVNENEVEAVFIRAPCITRLGDGVKVISSLETSSVGLTAETSALPVAVQQGKILGIAFHPELTTDTRWHSYFISLVLDTPAPKTAPKKPPKTATECNHKKAEVPKARTKRVRH